MNRGQFRELVLSITKFSGVPYVEDTTDINRLINERCRKFSELTWCLYDDAVVFSTAASSAVYDLRSASFGREMLEVDRLYIDGQPLRDFTGHYGPVQLDELVSRYPTYLTQPTQRPLHYCLLPSQKLRLFPCPGESYPNCFASGYYLPSNITTAASGDVQSIEVPEEFQTTAAYFTAASLLIPHSTGQTDYEKIALLSQEAAKEIQSLQKRNKRFASGPSIRGTQFSWV